MWNIEKISKIDAAERQLNAAIRLFFDEADMIAVHTLAAAATQVLTDIGDKRGVKNPIRDSDLIRPEYKSKFIKILKKPENFFKHADRNPDGILNFRPQGTPFLVFEGVIMHMSLTRKLTIETRVFMAWFSLKNPDLLLESEFKTSITNSLGGGVDPDDFAFMRESLKILDRFPDIEKWFPRLKENMS